jgi:flavin-dependent dehydrogenase
MTDYEVAIVGGGLAGLASSIEMARAGKRVVLFEKKQFPYHKVCGEYISMESWNYLISLGVDLENMDLPKVNRLVVSDKKGNSLKHKMNLGGFGISRYTLDHKLAQLAKKAGVELKENCRVEEIQFEKELGLNKVKAKHIIKSSQGEFSAELLVASYGKRSRLDKQWQRNFISKPLPADRNFTAVKYHLKAQLDADVIGLHIFDGGYCGISKVDGEDRYCLCYLTLASAVQKAGGIEALEEKVMRKNPYLDQYLKLPRLYEQPEVISQVNFSSRSQIESHAFMLGDTAGLIVPLCGNGMSMALHSAHLWSALALDYFDQKLNREDLEKAYQEIWNRTFKNRLAVGKSLQTVFYRHSMNSLLIQFLRLWPWLTKKLVGFTHGREILDDSALKLWNQR